MIKCERMWCGQKLWTSLHSPPYNGISQKTNLDACRSLAGYVLLLLTLHHFSFSSPLFFLQLSGMQMRCTKLMIMAIILIRLLATIVFMTDQVSNIMLGQVSGKFSAKYAYSSWKTSPFLCSVWPFFFFCYYLKLVFTSKIKVAGKFLAVQVCSQFESLFLFPFFLSRVVNEKKKKTRSRRQQHLLT